MADRLLTPAEAAERLSLSRATLDTWRSRPPKGGGPRYIRLGGAIRYAPADLDAWIAEHNFAHGGEAKVVALQADR